MINYLTSIFGCYNNDIVISASSIWAAKCNAVPCLLVLLIFKSGYPIKNNTTDDNNICYTLF